MNYLSHTTRSSGAVTKNKLLPRIGPRGPILALATVTWILLNPASSFGGESPAAKTISATPTNQSAAKRNPVPVGLVNCLNLLQQTKPISPGLVDSVIELITQSSTDDKLATSSEPSLLLVTYRQRNNTVSDVVVQLFHDTGIEGAFLNQKGYVRNRLGSEMFDSANQLMELIYNQVSYLGDEQDIRVQQRAFRTTLRGDLTLLREQTIEPLHVLAIMPEAGRYLPGSLRARVRSIVINAELSFGEWRGEVGLVTDDDQTAEQVGNVVAAWRDMAVSLADMYAGSTSGAPLRKSLESSSVRVAANRVLASASVPSKTVVRVSKEVMGHGAEPHTQGYWKNHPESWPVTQLTLGGVTYTQTQLMNLFNKPVGNDASLNLAHQLISAQLNLAAGVNPPPQVSQAITAANSLLSTYSGSLPYKVKTTSTVGQQMVQLASTLDYFNNGGF